ncbi:MAG: chromate transporter [Armatimonadota bacterium]|nr:chromate transporter [Armatimonadota bacterium]MDR7593926.1 chromate transporter [Armatimonadota bacterium]
MNPPSLIEILLVTALGGLAAFGGANGLVAVIQHQWVRSGVLDPQAFAWVFASSYLFPGPRAGFVAGVGYLLRGFPGAAAALVGVILPACATSALVHAGLRRLEAGVRSVAAPAAFVVAGLIAAAAWDLAVSLRPGWPELVGLAAAAWLAGPRDVEPLWLVLGAAGAGLLAAWLV